MVELTKSVTPVDSSSEVAYFKVSSVFYWTESETDITDIFYAISIGRVTTIAHATA